MDFAVKKTENDQRRRVRKVAVIAVSISIFAVVTAIITVPLLYSYAYRLQSKVTQQADYCKMRSGELWQEVAELQYRFQTFKRQRRGWLFGQWRDDGIGSGAASGSYGAPGPEPVYQPPAPPAFSEAAVRMVQCMCHYGPAGPPGPPGDDGKDGRDGQTGKDGKRGKNGEIMPSAGIQKEPCVICPPGMPGPPGITGPKGPRGPRGPSGSPGTDGQRGAQGMVGQPGSMGKQGPQGPQGERGRDGKAIIKEGSPGPIGPDGSPGPRGNKGPKGEPGKSATSPHGLPGDPGLPGKKGKKGPRGQQGSQGNRGLDGDCNHCPPPRTPPGY